MNIKEVKDYCLTLPHTKAYMPCGDDWMVFHMDGQIFLYIWLKSPIPVISVKLVPERGEELREKYNAFSPAYHLCEKHWNDILIEGTFSSVMIKEWIKESYDLAKKELPKFVHKSNFQQPAL